MYGSYSDEDLNEWERLPQNIRVLTSSAFGAWLLRRDERKREQDPQTDNRVKHELNRVKNELEPKTGRWITQWNVAHQKEYYYCSECREEFSYDVETGIKMNNYNYCPNCGAKLSEIPTNSESDG